MKYASAKEAAYASKGAEADGAERFVNSIWQNSYATVREVLEEVLRPGTHASS
ncbi:hypothetical protein [Actinomycetospora termitidis]|uniref:Uncharacterized protein n=1 Tax=Actinomycetospora termitidis TaxID=3053470 RepID=A0ABT7MIU0_9PSEU|nr:hypothetical protein [Actinomycetospora sp. Odt1-22]MDL5160594.1 hypothetical protein [Actinomycetospora sp. Odt1-22]